MFIAKVIGNTWGTKRHPALERRKLMLVQPIEGPNGRAWGEPLLAVDESMGSGPGDVVLVMDEGNSARQVLRENKPVPVRTVVCGIVDSITVSGKTVKFH